MPKRKRPPLTAEEQAERFRASAQELIDAGELNPTAADEALDALVRRSVKPKERDDEPKPK